MLIRNYSNFLWAGFILWVITLVLLAKSIYPYVFFTIVPAYILIIVGVIGWIKDYKITYNTFPNPFPSLAKSMTKFNILICIPFGFMHFIFTHIIHWFIFCILLMMILMVAIEPIAKNSKTFAIAKQFVESDSTLLTKIGKIKYYGLFLSGSTESNGDGKIRFTIIGEHKIIKARVEINNNKVVDIYYEGNE